MNETLDTVSMVPTHTSRRRWYQAVQSRYKLTAHSLIQLARAKSCFLSCRPRAHSIPLVAAQMGLSPSADVDQHRHSPSAAVAQM